MSEELTAPFPYFGGKSSVADLVWAALGQPKHYMEPFFGSGAVLLARPGYDPTQHVETVVDADGFVCNVWRGLQHDPDEVAKWCDWPVNHADLIARKGRLITNEKRLLEHLCTDDGWFDARLAGYWIWAASCWIGSGLTGPGSIPHLAGSGKGVHKLSQRPHLADSGKGVHRLSTRPHLSNSGEGVQDAYNANIYSWFRLLSERLRHVRVVCGDWTRICGGEWQDNMGDVGIFLDPPYSVEDRHIRIYHHESTTISQEVAAWAVERGKLRTYRIVVAGYDGEHPQLEAASWQKQRWIAGGGYGRAGSRALDNRKRECLWFSPYCIAQKQEEFKL